jgi:hypothetical protein
MHLPTGFIECTFLQDEITLQPDQGPAQNCWSGGFFLPFSIMSWSKSDGPVHCRPALAESCLTPHLTRFCPELLECWLFSTIFIISRSKSDGPIHCRPALDGFIIDGPIHCRPALDGFIIVNKLSMVWPNKSTGRWGNMSR